MHAYRTHNCAALTEPDVGQTVRLSGWIHRKRDHGQLVFIDLRDHFGLTQCVVDSSDASFALVEATRLESVVTITQVLYCGAVMTPLIPACQPGILRCVSKNLRYNQPLIHCRCRLILTRIRAKKPVCVIAISICAAIGRITTSCCVRKLFNQSATVWWRRISPNFKPLF